MHRAIVLALASLLATLAVTAQPRECRAGYCPTYTCYAPCGQGCVCVTPPGEFGGTCYGVQYAPEFRARGWRVLE